MVSRQFQVFRNPYPADLTDAVYFVVLQSDNLPEYPTVVVAPLVPDKAVAKSRLFHPRFEIEGKSYAIDMLQVGAMPRRDVGPPVAALDRHRVIDAYDALISGSWG
jgi:hypothetical protein